MTEAADPRARFRQLPEPVRPDELVETSDVNRPAEEEPVTPAWLELGIGGPGLP